MKITSANLSSNAVVTTLLLCMVIFIPVTQIQAQTKITDAAPTPPKWFLRLNKTDRACLDAVISEPLPDFPPEIEFIPGDKPLKRTDLLGKVVVFQSWTSKHRTGRNMPGQVQRNLKEIKSDDLLIIALHTPDGAEGAKEYLKKNPLDIPVIIDPVGEFCDAIGVYKRPVNLVIDKQGIVRYAGLNKRGLNEAVQKLLLEKFDPDKVLIPVKESAQNTPNVKSGNSDSTVAFPPIEGQISGSKKDVRGLKAPEIVVEKWITPKPNLTGFKGVIMVDFWATWCPPCRASIPHSNELADEFRDDLLIVGISAEVMKDFEEGLKKHDLPLSKFHYTLALDTQRRLSSWVGVRGIPHVIVLSSDGIVRWQGHPARLDHNTMKQIILANKSFNGSNTVSQENTTSTGNTVVLKPKTKRWTKKSNG